MRSSVKVWQLLLAMATTFILAAVGTAIATIPDSSGVIHGCYKKSGTNKGMVRVIDTAVTAKCPTGFAPLNWNQTGPQGLPGQDGTPGQDGADGLDGSQGPPGTVIAARLRLAAPVTVQTEEFADLPLNPGTWTQDADALNTMYARLVVTAPDILDCNLGASVTLNIFLDGTRLNGWQTSTFGGLTIARGATRTLEFSFVEQKLGDVHFGHVLFEPGADTEHTVTVQGKSTCEGTTFGDISFDVVSIG